jgi:hypothetical protein
MGGVAGISGGDYAPKLYHDISFIRVVAPMHAVFVAARLRSTWHPAFVPLWSSAVLSSDFPGTPGLRLEHQVPLVIALFGLTVEYRHGWRERGVVLCCLTMGHLAAILLSLASGVPKIGVTSAFAHALSLSLSWTWTFVRILLLLGLVEAYRREAWSRMFTLCGLIISTVIIPVLAGEV